MEFTQKRLQSAINEHGSLFQDACRDLLARHSGTTDWIVEDYEHPVSNEGDESRVDIVLRDNLRPDDIDRRVTIECKRANPDYVAWVFSKQVAVTGDYEFGSVLIGASPKRVVGRLLPKYSTQPISLSGGSFICDVGFALRDKKTRGGRSSAVQPIEDACRQALAGAYGLADEICLQYMDLMVPYRAMFIPVVVTTAPLYVAEYSPGDVDITTGTIEEDKVFFGGPEAVEWLVVDYPTGQRIDGAVGPDEATVDAGVLGRLSRRSVFVVNAGHLIEFFAAFHPATG